MLSNILAAFNLDSPSVVPFGSGLINNTWKIYANDRSYILQRINQHVFRNPENIAENIRLIGEYLGRHHRGYLFTLPEKTVDGKDILHNEEGYFRLFPFVEGSHTVDVVRNAEQAHAAAFQFGKFTSLLSGFPVDTLNITIPDFHNISLRYINFQEALKSGIAERIEEAKKEIAEILSGEHIVKKFRAITNNTDFKTRVTHHDTKISNVLFDEHGRGLCVIDLDTVMPGYFISDVGDMMRTYLCAVSEEETDLSKIEIRDDFYTAIVDGYSERMKDELTATERNSFMYAGQFMIYMQAIRFLTDHLCGDVYYGAKYPGHNLMRTRNQLTLLRKLSARTHLEKVSA